MSAITVPPSPFIGLPVGSRIASFRRFTVPEYHKLIEIGILTEDDDLELIDGHLVKKMSRNPDHDTGIDLFRETVGRLLPAGRMLRSQEAVSLSGSEPEPDFAVVRGGPRAYRLRHPSRADIDLLVEISNTTLDSDRAIKIPMYGHDGVAEYWIVNLSDRQIEVYSQPTGPTPSPGFATRTDYTPGQTVPLTLDGQLVADVPVDDLLP